MAKPEKNSPFLSPAPPFCSQHKEMGTGVLETLKHGSTPHPPRLAPPGCRHPWELWFGSASPHSLITRVGWPWSSGNGGAGLRDGTVFPHCSALPGVNPGLVSRVDIGCSQGKRGPLAGFGLPGRFPKRNRGGCCWQTLPKTAGWGLSVPKAQRSPRDPHFGILPSQMLPVPAALSRAAHAANSPEHHCEKRHGEKTILRGQNRQGALSR